MKIRRKGSEPRSTVFTIRLSPSELAQLRSLADAAGLSIAAYLLSLAFPSPSKEVQDHG